MLVILFQEVLYFRLARIHDISRTELDKKTSLPRFNMPFELGLFLGAKKFGAFDQSKKRTLILDKKKHRKTYFGYSRTGPKIS